MTWASRKVAIRINEYRMRHGASRALVGIMAGKDTIRSTVEIRDGSGHLLGSSEIDSGWKCAFILASDYQ